jgi:HSP20 family molecular chaperone IbpA
MLQSSSAGMSFVMWRQVLSKEFLIMSLPTRVQRYADPVDSAQREFDIMLGRFFGSRVLDGGEYPAPHGVDVREDADRLIVEADVPGYKKDEIEINMENQTLTISAAHKEEHREPRPNGCFTKGAIPGSFAASLCRQPSMANPFRPN